MNKQEKWWYRLAQVTFGVFVAFLIGVGALVVMAYKPDLNIYNSKYKLECDNGERRGNFTGEHLDFMGYDFAEESYREAARLACAVPNETNEEFRERYALYQRGEISVPPLNNYKVIVVGKEYYGSWFGMFLAVVISSLSVLVISLLIRAIFLYVAFKEPFLETFITKPFSKLKTRF
jgi:hypothetical protein